MTRSDASESMKATATVRNSMPDTDHRDLIIRYYDACNAADEAALLDVLTPDMTHYFLAPNPAANAVRGGAVLAAGVSLLQRSYQGRWVMDHCLGSGDEAVIEWTLYWTSPKT